MGDPASTLAELMNQCNSNYAADSSFGMSRPTPVVNNGPSASENPVQSQLPRRNPGPPVEVAKDYSKHIEAVAAQVCELLGTRVKPWLQRKLRAWPYVLEDADDLGQLAALAFVEGYRQGRVKPDPETQQHTASSVSAYLWGICNHIFIDTLRSSRQVSEQRDVSLFETSKAMQESSPLERIMFDSPEDDEESRLWSVLSAVRNRCKPQDIVMTYLLGCGFSSGEVRSLLDIGINTPARATKRVGQAVREVLGLDPVPQPEASAAEERNLSSRKNGVSQGTSSNASSSSLSALGLLIQKSFTELVQRLDSPPVRSMFLREAAAALGPAGSAAVEQSLAERQYAVRAHGDWSWGLLSVGERRELLLRDARLLLGAGIPDDGAAQRAALKKLVAEMGNIFQELDQALLGDDLDWLLPLAEHLHVLLGIISEFKEMRQRYRALLEAARRMNSPRLEMLAQLGLGSALVKLGKYPEASEALERSAQLAREMNEPRAEGLALGKLAEVYHSQGDYTRVTDLYEQCLPIFRAIGDRHGEAAALEGLARNHKKLGNYESVEELERQVLVIRRQIGDRHGIASALCELANVESLRGNNAAAHKLYSESLAIMRDIGDRRCIAVNLGNLGIVETDRGNYAVARDLLNQSLDIRREIGDRSGIADCFGSLAIVEAIQGNYDAASELYAKSVAIWREINDRQCLAKDLGNLGNVESTQGNFNASRDLYKESLAIKREIGDRYGIAVSLGNLAMIEGIQGNYDAARMYAAESITIAREMGDRGTLAHALFVLGEIENSLGNQAAALELLSESLAILHEQGDVRGMCFDLPPCASILASCDLLTQAALCLYGAIHCANQLGIPFNPQQCEGLEQTRERIEHPETGLSAEERKKIKAQAESMSLDELAEFALAELAKLKDTLPADQS